MAQDTYQIFLDCHLTAYDVNTAGLKSREDLYANSNITGVGGIYYESGSSILVPGSTSGSALPYANFSYVIITPNVFPASNSPASMTLRALPAGLTPNFSDVGIVLDPSRPAIIPCTNPGDVNFSNIGPAFVLNGSASLSLVVFTI